MWSNEVEFDRADNTAANPTDLTINPQSNGIVPRIRGGLHVWFLIKVQEQPECRFRLSSQGSFHLIYFPSPVSSSPSYYLVTSFFLFILSFSSRIVRLRTYSLRVLAVLPFLSIPHPFIITLNPPLPPLLHLRLHQLKKSVETEERVRHV